MPTSISYRHFMYLVHLYTGSQNTQTHKTQINKYFFISMHTTHRLSWPCRLEDKCLVFRMLSPTQFFFREIPLENALNPIHMLVSSHDLTISTYSKVIKEPKIKLRKLDCLAWKRKVCRESVTVFLLLLK